MSGLTPVAFASPPEWRVFVIVVLMSSINPRMGSRVKEFVVSGAKRDMLWAPGNGSEGIPGGLVESHPRHAKHLPGTNRFHCLLPSKRASANLDTIVVYVVPGWDGGRRPADLWVR